MQNSSKKPKSDLLRLSVTLFVIAGVMALLVALVNNVTAAEIERRNADKITMALKAVMPEAQSFEAVELENTTVKSADGKDVKIDGAWTAESDGKRIGVCVRVSPQGYGGAIETIVGIDTAGDVVGTQIVSISETSGIGTKIQGDSFLSQFLGKSGQVTGVETATDKNQVQTISGATKSSKAYIRGINAALTVASEIPGGDGK